MKLLQILNKVHEEDWPFFERTTVINIGWPIKIDGRGCVQCTYCRLNSHTYERLNPYLFYKGFLPEKPF